MQRKLKAATQRSALALMGLSMLTATLTACTPSDEPASSKAPPVTAPVTFDKKKANNTLWSSHQEYSDAYIKASNNLSKAIAAFLQTPNTERLNSAQAQWRKTDLTLTKLQFIFDLAEQNPSTLETLFTIEYSIAAKPIQPGYLDSFGPYEFSGLVHDIGVELSALSLRAQHGATDTEEVVLGLYAIEYLLFGENNSRTSADFEPQSSLDAKEAEKGFKSVQELPKNRRRNLLNRLSELLVLDSAELGYWMKAAISGTSNNTSTERWLDLEKSTQAFKIKEALKAALTQSLLDISELQSSSRLDNKSANATDSNRENAARKLNARLSAIGSATLFLDSDIGQGIEKHLTETNIALETTQTSPSSELKDLLTTAYEELKAAIDSLETHQQ